MQRIRGFQKSNKKNEIEKSFLDPFNGATIPYDFYLAKKNKTADIVKDDTVIEKIWRLKKVTEKVRKIDRQPKPVAVKKESDEMSIHEMKSGKRKSMDNNENPPKKQKVDQNIVTKKLEQKDFKIFGSDKFSKSAKK